MTAGGRRGLGLLVAAALVVGGGLLAQRSEVMEQVVAERAVADGLAARVSVAEHIGVDVGGDLDEARAETTLYAVLLDRRVDFVTSVSRAAEALAAASGKVDTSTQRAEVIAAQEMVRAERTDAAAVVAAVAEVDAVTAAVTQAVQVYDAEQQRLAAMAASRALYGPVVRSTAPLPVGSAYERVRAALDRVGGGGVPLEEFSGACAGGTAVACASSSGIISFTAELGGWSDGRLHWAMAHELAHIHQFRVWGALQASGSYAALFGGNVELLANCMAAHRGHPSASVSCSGAQIDFGAAVWSGYVPG